MKITEFPAAASFAEDTVMLVDGAAGTKTMPVKDAFFATMDLMGPETHRMFFRGKNLGTAVTETQRNAIANGTFDDIWVGDYWEINGYTWRIVDINYWLNCGDTKLTTPHVVIMPDERLATSAINPEALTTGGYAGSDFYTTSGKTIVSTVENAFGDAIITRREYLTTAVTDGVPSAGSWHSVTVIFPDEMMVYGARVHFPANDGSATAANFTTSKSQLAAFRLNPQLIFKTGSYWLRDVVSDVSFANVQGTGITSYAKANVSVGVRPVFAIG